MNKLEAKVSAILAIGITVLCFVIMIISLVSAHTVTYSGEGMGDSFSIWIIGIILALFSLVFYIFDAVMMIVEAIKGTDRIFNLLLAAFCIGNVPMVIYVGTSTKLSYLWYIYSAVLFVLEIISIVRHIRIPNDGSDTEQA